MEPESASRQTVLADAALLLREIGWAAPFDLAPLSGGANNSVYRVTGLEPPLVLKSYFHQPGDPRDRFRSERVFYEFAAAAGVGKTPAPLAWSESRRLALFEFLPGERLRPDEIDARRVREALQFYLDLNLCRDDPAAERMPPASEACFTLADHLACVERRVARLEKIEPDGAVEREAAAFISDRLRPAWDRHRMALWERIAAEDDAPLPRDRQGISPSDFGFHNALRREGGEIAFFDFEYAGWDDPAKFLCDFLCQPAVPVPEALRPLCLEMLCHPVPGGTDRARAAALFPLFQLKWGCIVLNEFLPAARERRRFAQKLEPRDFLEIQRRQLAKAADLLEKIGPPGEDPFAAPSQP